jgi:hypothetical protein
MQIINKLLEVKQNQHTSIFDLCFVTHSVVEFNYVISFFVMVLNFFANR